MVQVIFQIELVEIERGQEGCEMGRRVRGAQEGEGEVWPICACAGGGRVSQLVGGL